MRGRRLAAVGAKEFYTITRPAPTEHTGLTTVLPTTEPGSSQISVTIASGDFYLPSGLIAPYIGNLLAQVLNNDGSSRTVSWRILKNGSSVATGSVSVTASQRGRIQGFFSPTAVSGDSQGTGVVAGDTLELRLWSAGSTNVQLVYWTYFLMDTRTRPSGARYVENCTLTSIGSTTPYPTLSSWPGGGTSSVSNVSVYVGDDPNAAFVVPSSTTPINPRGLYLGGYGLVRITNGDVSFANSASTSGAAAPTYIAHNGWAAMALRRNLG